VLHAVGKRVADQDHMIFGFELELGRGLRSREDHSDQEHCE
jgi:hypothetical protein